MSISGSSHNLIASVSLLDEQQTIDRIFTHIDEGTTDLGDTVWREPVENYHSQERFDAEIALAASTASTFLSVSRPTG